MCGRFSLHDNPDVIVLQSGVGMLPQFKARYNIAASTNILIVKQDPDTGRTSDVYRWGLIPDWAKDPSIGNKLANARGQSVAEKPSFRAAFKRWQCLVPTSGFYEWKAVGGRNQPFYIRPKGRDLFGFAGIIELWKGPEGPVHAVSLVTMEPNELMRAIHDRMPVIIPTGGYGDWPDPANQGIEKLKTFIRPFPEEMMTAYPVSTWVSNAKNEGEELIDPVAA